MYLLNEFRGALIRPAAPGFKRLPPAGTLSTFIGLSAADPPAVLAQASHLSTGLYSLHGRAPCG